MGRHEVKVTGRGYHAQGHKCVSYEGILRASIEEVRELHEAHDVESLRCGLVIEEVPSEGADRLLPCAARPWMGSRRREYPPKIRPASRCTGFRPARRAFTIS